MTRLSTRLMISHLVVAAVGVVTVLTIVRWLAPQLFDQSMRGSDMSPGRGGGLRTIVADAVTTSLLAGGAVGIVVALGLGWWVARRLTRTLAALQAGTRRIAAGDYTHPVPVPSGQELGDVARDVNVLAQTLADTESRRLRLLGEVAHEMRTPLTVIDGYVEGLIDGVLPADPQTLGQLAVETRRLRRLADDLSTLSRAEEGRLTVQLTRMDLAQTVAGVIERLGPQAQDAGLVLSAVVRPQPVWVNGDADRLAQVLTNLVGNAITATADGAITVTCDVVRGSARVEVCDTGEGLAADQLELIFERFYRVPGRRSTSTDTGSGIGLSVARAIVADHGGSLTAASDGPGQGATFTLTLPLADAPTGSLNR